MKWWQILYTVTTNKMFSYDKCVINLRPIQEPGKKNPYPENTNTIFFYEKYNIQYR